MDNEVKVCGGPTPLGGIHRPCTRPAGHPGDCQVTDVTQLIDEPGPAGFLAAFDGEGVLQLIHRKYSRRFQLLPVIAVCNQGRASSGSPVVPPSCLWSFEGEDQPQVEQQAREHIDGTGHEVRVISPSLVILGPAAADPAAAPAEPVDVAGQPA